MLNYDDPRVKRTRQLIVQAFIDLMKEKGFDAVTIKDIAERATVNRATFYTHYEDKYALVKYLTEQSFRQIMAEHSISTDTFTETTCRQLILLTYEYTTQFYQLCKLNTESVGALIDEKVKQILQKKIEEMILHGQPLNTKTQTMIAMISESIYAVAFQMSILNLKNVDDLIDNTVRFLMAGLQTVKY